MPRNRKLPSIEVVRALVGEGLSNREIGERYGSTGEAVRQLLDRHGIRRPSGRTDHSIYLPWRIRADHASDTIAKRLREYSKRQQGAPLSDTENKMLDAWMAFMDGDNPSGMALSVHYDRTDGEGFWLEPRRPGDRDYISPPAKQSQQ